METSYCYGYCKKLTPVSEFNKSNEYLTNKGILYNFKCRKCNERYEYEYENELLPWQKIRNKRN